MQKQLPISSTEKSMCNFLKIILESFSFCSIFTYTRIFFFSHLHNVVKLMSIKMYYLFEDAKCFIIRKQLRKIIHGIIYKLFYPFYQFQVILIEKIYTNIISCFIPSLNNNVLQFIHLSFLRK